MTKMTKTKLKEKGHIAPARSIEEITKDYNTECFYAGHKQRLVSQWKTDMERMEKEIALHLARAITFNAEGMARSKELDLIKQAEAQNGVSGKDLERAADLQKAKESASNAATI